MRGTCITHRRDPIFRGTLEGTLPGSYSEHSVMSSIQRAAIAWNILTVAGIPGIRDVFVPPITNDVNIVVQIKKAYPGQPKQIAAALWGNSAAQYRYKHVTVVEEDIDASSYDRERSLSEPWRPPFVGSPGERSDCRARHRRRRAPGTCPPAGPSPVPTRLSRPHRSAGDVGRVLPAAAVGDSFSFPAHYRR